MSKLVIDKNLKLLGILTVFVVVLFLFFNGSIIGKSTYLLDNLKSSLSGSSMESAGLTDSVELYNETTSDIFSWVPLALVGIVVIGFVLFAGFNLMKY
ncbi:MAG: hypothetical protein JW703_00525 [Candidatus Diapherotrites archaeon]|nr:hypothetical protein [Candidatus Diapherotrites archaeon]